MPVFHAPFLFPRVLNQKAGCVAPVSLPASLDESAAAANSAATVFVARRRRAPANLVKPAACLLIAFRGAAVTCSKTADQAFDGDQW
jgi:hypothetical protein